MKYRWNSTRVNKPSKAQRHKRNPRKKKRERGLSYTTHKQRERKSAGRPPRSATALANTNKQNKHARATKDAPVQSGLLLLYTNFLRENSEDDDSRNAVLRAPSAACARRPPGIPRAALLASTHSEGTSFLD